MAEVMELAANVKPTCSSVHKTGDGVRRLGGAEEGRVQSEPLRRGVRPVDGQHVFMRDNSALGVLSVVSGDEEVFKELG